MDAFAARLDAELADAETLEDFETVYFGGGTPTAFSHAQLTAIFDAFDRRVRRSPGCETTMEANPSTLSPEKCRGLRERGVNRVSLGAQSFDDAVLGTLGRHHSRRAIRESWDHLRSAGFENLNLDLMFGVPGQNLENWESSLRAALELKPEHISCYNLTYEEDTPYMERFRRGIYGEDNGLNESMFTLAEEMLGAAGFGHYEISNYAKPGFECRHNLAYWTGRDYLGIGTSAVSTVRGDRWKMAGGRRVALETLSPGQRTREQALLELRTSRGADARAFDPGQWEPLVEHGLAVLKDQRLVLTHEGRLRADEIAVQLI
jgi:oxygen-independent coproporphyrinogen-3 oxidase